MLAVLFRRAVLVALAPSAAALHGCGQVAERGDAGSKDGNDAWTPPFYDATPPPDAGIGIVPPREDAASDAGLRDTGVVDAGLCTWITSCQGLPSTWTAPCSGQTCATTCPCSCGGCRDDARTLPEGGAIQVTCWTCVGRRPGACPTEPAHASTSVGGFFA
jgi:hypothetical protein